MSKPLVMLLWLFISFSVYGQISPGDLTIFHADLEGMENCTKCHSLGNQVTRDKCLACHKEIKSRIDANRGYHSSSEVKNKDCWKCHSEHNGRTFEIVHFDKNKFDHSKTSFNLSGSHLNLQCDKCHKQEFINDPTLKKRKMTFLGLDQKCSTCHEDSHQGTLGSNCSSCHNTDKFKPASLFNHNKAKYVLTGAHIKVECDKCHAKETLNGKSFQKFKGLLFGNCNDCHSDFHKGKFGNDCKKCHNTFDFNSVNTSSFDHSKTNFNLIGMHKEVECNDCHGQNLSSKPKHDNCYDCHKDFHKGQFTINKKITDCKECHTEKGFSPSTYTITMHSKTHFELTGGHLAIPCKACHMLKDEWVFRIEKSRCINCHENIHKEEISKKFMNDSECSNCHNTESWNKVNFDHAKTDFALSGKHSVTNCRKCHLVPDGSEPKLLFASLKTDCESCHKDVHNAQFKENNITECGRCHSFDNWKPTKFDHSKTRFALNGAHKDVECSKCHKEMKNINQQFINYKIEDIRCAACHS